MAELNDTAARHLLQACIALDEAHYRISCAIVAAAPERDTSEIAAQINARLSAELQLLRAITPARRTCDPPTPSPYPAHKL